MSVFLEIVEHRRRVECGVVDLLFIVFGFLDRAFISARSDNWFFHFMMYCFFQKEASVIGASSFATESIW